MKKTLLLPIVVASLIAQAKTFEQHWHEMQGLYLSLSKKCAPVDISLLHPYWNMQKEKIKKIILGKPDHQFLTRDPIPGTMVRSEYGKTQEYEITYLKNCIKEKTRDLLSNFSDTTLPCVPFICGDFNCSVNTLGQLYYFARMMDLFSGNPNVIVEFGGGFGCLCRIAKRALPEVTFVIVDLPEFLAFQYQFLGSTLENVEIIAHTSAPSSLKAGAIHLVPVSLMKDLPRNADIFVSNFGLSETPLKVQEEVVESKFFDASLIFIAGQLNQWGTNHNFESHTYLFSNIDRQFFSVRQPFHDLSGDLRSYELYGIRAKK